jgi:hypothetical protein
MTVDTDRRHALMMSDVCRSAPDGTISGRASSRMNTQILISPMRRPTRQTEGLWCSDGGIELASTAAFRSDYSMAKQIITVLTDDLDGGDADRTIEFGLDGVTYTIDLSEKNAGKLRKALDPYLAAAARVGRTNGRVVSRAGAAPSRANRDQNQAIREWATKNGYEVSERGRIPSSIVEAFHAKR